MSTVSCVQLSHVNTKNARSQNMRDNLKALVYATVFAAAVTLLWF